MKIITNYCKKTSDCKHISVTETIENEQGSSNIYFGHSDVNISQVTRIWQVTLVFLNFHPYSKFPPAFIRILLKSPAITRILFDWNKIAQANLFAERKEKYWSQVNPNLIKLVMCGKWSLDQRLLSYTSFFM